MLSAVQAESGAESLGETEPYHADVEIGGVDVECVLSDGDEDEVEHPDSCPPTAPYSEEGTLCNNDVLQTMLSDPPQVTAGEILGEPCFEDVRHLMCESDSDCELVEYRPSSTRPPLFIPIFDKVPLGGLVQSLALGEGLIDMCWLHCRMRFIIEMFKCSARVF